MRFRQKAEILYEKGYLRDADLFDAERITARWLIYENVPQKTAKEVKAERLTEKEEDD